MGLDMYLTHHVDRNHKQGGRIAYWRKANAIHSWFVKNVQGGVDDCGMYLVPKEKIEELLDICSKINDHIHESPDQVLHLDTAGVEMARLYLPTQTGFFFGSTTYGYDYCYHIRYTIEYLNAALIMLNVGGAVFYQSSW